MEKCLDSPFLDYDFTFQETHQVSLYQIHNWTSDANPYDPISIIHLINILQDERPPYSKLSILKIF